MDTTGEKSHGEKPEGGEQCLLLQPPETSASTTARDSTSLPADTSGTPSSSLKQSPGALEQTSQK